MFFGCGIDRPVVITGTTAPRASWTSRASRRAYASKGRPQQLPRDPNQMQRMMTERQIGRIKEALQPSEEEWKALEPKVTKVLTLSRQTGGMGMVDGMFRRPGGQGPEFPRDESPDRQEY